MVLGFFEGDNISGVEKEVKITKELQEVIELFREIAEKEDQFLNQVKNGQKSHNEFENNLKDVYIEMEEDIEDPLKTVNQQIKELRSSDSSNLDKEVENKLEEALMSLEKEEKRFKNLVGEAEKHEENQDITETEAADRLDKFERRELREVLDQAETKIAYCQNKLKKDVEATS